MNRNEATTCDDLIMPQLKKALWYTNVGRVEREYSIAKGAVHTDGKTHNRSKAQRADYLLRYKNLPLAIVEAKAEARHHLEGADQAKNYANQLGAPFAYATNGHEIEFFNIQHNTQKTVAKFHTPEELWQLHIQNLKTKDLNMSPQQQQVLLQNYYSEDGVGQQRQLRAYQEKAINSALTAILQGKRRILMSMATGTGKTFTAIQLVYKLWKAQHIRRVLFIVDRNMLADQAFDDFNSAMDKGACFRIEPNEPIPMTRDLYFGIYQSLVGIDDEDNPTGKPDRFKEFNPDFFDLIVVDEAHRGARRGTQKNEQSSWFRLLDYFNPAIQIGLTATPRRDESNDTYAHFNTQVIEYSLKQGIQDGYLAPYIIKSVTSNIDVLGYRPEHSQIKDVRGQNIEYKDYETIDFERELSIPQRTSQFAHHLIKHLFSTDPLGKTIVFCVNVDHALDMAKYCNEYFNAYKEKYKLNHYTGDYAVRITGNDKTTRGKYPSLENFQNVDSHQPIIATTSRLLTTGIDVKNLKNVVIFKSVNSWVEFKQIIGRGTRIFEHSDPHRAKLSFYILEYANNSTKNFQDPAWDGHALDEQKDKVLVDKKIIDVDKKQPIEIHDLPLNDEDIKNLHYRMSPDFLKGRVSIVAEKTSLTDADGKPLSEKEFIVYQSEALKKQIGTLYDLSILWQKQNDRKSFEQSALNDNINIAALKQIFFEKNKNKLVDTLDVLAHLLFNQPYITKVERVARAKKLHPRAFSLRGVFKLGDREAGDKITPATKETTETDQYVDSHSSHRDAGRTKAIQMMSDIINQYTSTPSESLSFEKEFWQLPAMRSYGGITGADQILQDYGGVHQVIQTLQKAVYDKRVFEG